MGASAAQFQFAAEIVTFLVALAGVALLVLRIDLLARRWPSGAAMAAGFASLAASAFVHGAVLPGQVSPAAVIALRLAAAVALAAAASPRLGWAPGAGPGRLVWAGALLVAASASAAPTRSVVITEALLVAGAVGVGAAVADASRRMIGARLAATAAGTLLLIVVVLSAALSTVLSDTVRNDGLRRIDARAAVESTALRDAWVSDLRDAKVVAAAGEAAFVQPSGAPDPSTWLAGISTRFFSDVHLLWVAPGGAVLAASPGFDQAMGAGVAHALGASVLVSRAFKAQSGAGTAGVVAGRPVAVGAYPALVSNGSATTVIGVAVAVTPMDSVFLRGQASDDPTLSLVITDGRRVLSAYPAAPGSLPSPVAQLAGEAITSSGAVGAGATTVDGRFVSVRPVVGAEGTPVMAVVAESPTSVFDNSRQSLFRTMFLIALGGSVLAFLLSVVVSDRISRGLESLTAAARRISGGETMVRTGVTSPDEIGVLAEAFDSMAESIEEKEGALRLAADEEARLRGRLESVVAGMAEALVAVDVDGRITDFNRAAEALSGTRRGRAAGRRLSSVLAVTLDDGRDLDAALADPGRLPLSGEGAATAGDGQLVPVAVSAAALSDPGGRHSGAVVLLRDLRRELELERMKTEFLSRIGHELRTPLTAIVGFTEILSRRQVPPQQAGLWHAEILEQSRRLMRTVEMLEFFASSGANRIEVDGQPVAARAVLDEAMDRWADKVHPPHTLSRRVARGVPPVLADRRWVGLALDELIDNAVKFSPEGGRVVLEAGPGPGAGTVSLTVRDQGKGMSDEERDAAFAEFVQGDSSDTRRFGGLGLGLPLVMRVAEGHGGRVECESAVGRGSAVSLILPVAPAPRAGGARTG